jgi:hypothetical protein
VVQGNDTLLFLFCSNGNVASDDAVQQLISGIAKIHSNVSDAVLASVMGEGSHIFFSIFSRKKIIFFFLVDANKNKRRLNLKHQLGVLSSSLKDFESFGF